MKPAIINQYKGKRIGLKKSVDTYADDFRVNGKRLMLTVRVQSLTYGVKTIFELVLN